MKNFFLIITMAFVFLQPSFAKQINYNNDKHVYQDISVNFTPEAGEKNVSPDVVIKVEFDADISPDCIKKNNIILKRVSGKRKRIHGELSYSKENRIISFTPNNSLEIGMYRVMLKNLTYLKTHPKEGFKKYKHKTIKYTFEVSNNQIIDTTPPIITLNGDNPISIVQGEEYFEEGATALDEIDGIVDVNISGSVDTSVIAEYSIVYTAIDSAGNQVSITRAISVVEPPIILESLTLSSTYSVLRISQTTEINLLASYSDGSTTNVAYDAIYDITNPNVAIVSGEQIEALSEGTTTISASMDNISSNTIEIKVVEAFDTSNFDFTNFGYQYIKYIPADATKTSFDEKRLTMITGKVFAEDGSPLSSVKVTIHESPEYGSQTTDSSGQYVFAAEDGYRIIRFTKDGYTTIDRKIDTLKWSLLPDITMLKIDSKVTAIDLNSTLPQIHTSTPVIDDRGQRSTTLVFNNISNATVTALDGTTRELKILNVRATEFKTPESMPADLPRETAYTYCSDITVDGVSDNEIVTFDAPVIMYVENFLGFDIGEIVPVGYYDRNSGKWICSDNGVVIILLDIDGDGKVDALDSTGDGNPNDLDGDGLYEDEISGLPSNSIYSPGKTFWRAEITHFTPWDYNWPFGPPDDAEDPENPDVDPNAPYDPCSMYVNSYIKPKSRVFHEDIPIAGTDETLHYSSKRVDGFDHLIELSIDANTVPASVIGIEVQLSVAGRLFKQTLTTNQLENIQFTWDGLDLLGNKVQGEIDAFLTISYEYVTVYYSANSDFDRAWAKPGVNILANRSRQDIKTSTMKVIKLFSEKNEKSFPEGWTLSNHNKGYINTVSMGNGESINSNQTKYINTISTVAGNGDSTFYGDGGDAKLASLYYPSAIEIGNDKNIYIADNRNYRVRMIDSSGIITTVAGNGSSGTVIDGTDAISAPISNVNDIDIDTDGNLYIASCKGVFKVNTTGIISTVTKQFYCDEGSESANYLDVDIDGNVFVGTYKSIFKISPCGDINRVVGNGSYGETIEGSIATQTPIQVSGMALDSKGNIYVSTRTNYIYKVDTTGIITRVAGNGISEHSGDNGNALDASLKSPRRVMVDKEENIYFTTDYGVRKIDTSNIITTVAGNGISGYSGDGGDAINASFYYAQGLAVNDNSLYIVDSWNHRIREVLTPPLVKKLNLNINEYLYKYSDNTADVFDSSGKHIRTVNISTANILKEFLYDNQGNLLSITDQFNNAITIERDGSGNPTSITAPNGQKTVLELDANSDLISVSYEDGSAFKFEYDNGSLMTKEIDLNDNIYTHFFDENGRIYQDTDSIGGNWGFYKDSSAKIQTYTSVMPNGEETIIVDTKNEDASTTSTITLPTGDIEISIRSADGITDSSTVDGVNTETIYTSDSFTGQGILQSKITAQPSGLSNLTIYDTVYDANETHTNAKTQTITQNSKITTITDDYDNAIKTITTPQNRELKTIYNKTNSLVTSVQSGTLTPTIYEYDEKGEVIKGITGDRVTSYTYDTKGNIATITNPRNETLSYEYDIMDRVINITHPDGTSESYEYDFNSNMTKLTTPTPSNFGFSYNGIDKRTDLTSPLGYSTSYAYDKNRKLTSIVRPSGKTITNNYVNDRLTSTVTPEVTTSYTYLFADKIGTVTSGSENMTYIYDGELLTSQQQNGILNQNISYTYNNDFLVTSSIYAGKTTTYTYDNDGLLTSSAEYSISRDTENAYATSISDGILSRSLNYNNYGEIIKSSDNTFTYELSQRDNAGNITQKKENINSIETIYDYTYDTRARLVEVKKNNTIVEQYIYDANSNRLEAIVNGVTTQASYTLDDNLEVYGDNTYRYDEDGYLIEKTTPTETAVYTYNTLGALTSVITPTKTINYHLNALNQRVAKEVDGIIVEKYLWRDLITLLAIYDNDNSLIQRFEYTDNRMPISMTQDNQKYYLHYDQVGTLRAVTDSNHNIIKEITYDTFGTILNDTNQNFAIPFGFAGGLHDRDTNLVHFGYREYSPYTGKWAAKDPIDFQGGDSNLYGYVLGDPVNFVDPKGLMSKTQLAIWAAIAAMKLFLHELPTKIPDKVPKFPVEKPKKDKKGKNSCG